LIDIRAQLTNPFDWDYFKSLGSTGGKLFAHKYWEVEHNFYGNSLLDIDFHIAIREDHAGLSLTLGVMGYGVHLHVYDNRHWNRNTNSWAEHNFDEYFKDNR
jgi:hypothetical protein